MLSKNGRLGIFAENGRFLAKTGGLESLPCLYSQREEKRSETQGNKMKVSMTFKSSFLNALGIDQFHLWKLQLCNYFIINNCTISYMKVVNSVKAPICE